MMKTSWKKKENWKMNEIICMSFISSFIINTGLIFPIIKTLLKPRKISSSAVSVHFHKLFAVIQFSFLPPQFNFFPLQFLTFFLMP